MKEEKYFCDFCGNEVEGAGTNMTLFYAPFDSRNDNVPFEFTICAVCLKVIPLMTILVHLPRPAEYRNQVLRKICFSTIQYQRKVKVEK